MRKINHIIITLVIVLFGINAKAQLTSKKGEPILPQQGDIALGFDARPFTNFFNDNSFVNTNFIDNQAIYAKYFIADQLAVRGNLRINYTVNENNQAVVDDYHEAILPNQYNFVEDLQKTKTSNYIVGLGIEKRRGETRVQGFFGGELQFIMRQTNIEYEYGNAMSTTNPAPTTTNFGTNLVNGFTSDQRFTKMETGKQFSTGVRGFIGAEYFIAPKLSVGGEFGWGVNFNFNNDTENTFEYWEDNQIKEQIIKTPNDKTIDIDTDNFGGAVYFLLHF